MVKNGLVAGLATLLMAGCALEADGTASPDINLPIAAEQLAAPADFDVLTDEASVVTLELGGSLLSDGDDRVVTDLAVVAGNIRARSEADALIVEVLELHIGDIVVPSEVYGPNGWHATDVVLALPSELRMTANGDGSWTSTQLDLDLSWNVVLSNGTAPLAAQRLSELPIEARLERDENGGLELELSITGEGTLWEFGELLELNRVAIDLTAAN